MYSNEHASRLATLTYQVGLIRPGTSQQDKE